MTLPLWFVTSAKADGIFRAMTAFLTPRKKRIIVINRLARKPTLSDQL